MDKKFTNKLVPPNSKSHLHKIEPRIKNQTKIIPKFQIKTPIVSISEVKKQQERKFETDQQIQTQIETDKIKNSQAQSHKSKNSFSKIKRSPIDVLYQIKKQKLKFYHCDNLAIRSCQPININICQKDQNNRSQSIKKQKQMLNRSVYQQGNTTIYQPINVTICQGRDIPKSQSIKTSRVSIKKQQIPDLIEVEDAKIQNPNNLQPKKRKNIFGSITKSLALENLQVSRIQRTLLQKGRTPQIKQNYHISLEIQQISQCCI